MVSEYPMFIQFHLELLDPAEVTVAETAQFVRGPVCYMSKRK